MDADAFSIFVFSIYELATGLGFLFFPNQIFKLFKIEQTTEPWIKIVGAMALIVGYYNLTIAQQGIEEMYWPTIYARIGFTLVIVFLINFHKAPKVLYLFALVDVIASIWTYMAIS